MTGSVKMWLLAFVVAAGVGFGTLVGVGCVVNANVCPFGDNQKISATEGREIWIQASCFACHGAEGQGGRGPSLVTGRPATYTLDELRSKIARGKPLAGMPMFKRELTPAQIEAVARYVIQLREAR